MEPPPEEFPSEPAGLLGNAGPLVLWPGVVGALRYERAGRGTSVRRSSDAEKFDLVLPLGRLKVEPFLSASTVSSVLRRGSELLLEGVEGSTLMFGLSPVELASGCPASLLLLAPLLLLLSKLPP